MFSSAPSQHNSPHLTSSPLPLPSPHLPRLSSRHLKSPHLALLPPISPDLLSDFPPFSEFFKTQLWLYFLSSRRQDLPRHEEPRHEPLPPSYLLPISFPPPPLTTLSILYLFPYPLLPSIVIESHSFAFPLHVLPTTFLFSSLCFPVLSPFPYLSSPFPSFPLFPPYRRLVPLRFCLPLLSYLTLTFISPFLLLPHP